MTLAPLLSEAVGSLAKASTPQPWSTSKTSNWVARAGGLPDYIQHISHGIYRSQKVKDESRAIAMAIGVCKNPPASWDAEAKAACAKAIAEWEAKKAGSHAKVKESIADAMAGAQIAVDSALLEIATFESVLGVDGMIALLAEGALAEAEAWKPTLKRTASSNDEMDRHEVYDGGQHVGTISRRRGFGTDPVKHSAFAVNGARLTDYSGAKNQDGAIEALRKHLEEAPARVISWPTAGKYLVAQPSSYSGETNYKSYSSEGAARHAAGLPPVPTVPERNTKVEAVAEAVRFDLLTVAHLDVPPLRRVQEARRRDPFELLENFHPDELRGFGGKWVGSGHHSTLTARSVVPRMRGRMAAEIRYEGGVRRESTRLRLAHARRPQIARATDEHPEHALAAAVKSGSWDRSAAAVSRRLIAQKQLPMDELSRRVSAGKALDTEAAHRTGPGGAYSPERQALHEHIISLLLQGKGVHEGNARAVFTAGGGASGKSSLISSGEVHVPHDAVIANPDVIREMLPEYKALKAAGREDAASLTHEEASHITKVLTRLALGRQHHVLVDGTGNSGTGKFAGKVRAAQEAGHTVSVHYATVPTSEAIRRADARGDKTGRYVEHSVLRQQHKSVSANFSDVAKVPGVHLQVFDTSGAASKAPELVAERKARSDKLVIGNREKHQGFLAKANE